MTESPFGKPNKQRLDEPNVGRMEIAGGTRVKLDISSPQSMMSYKPQKFGVEEQSNLIIQPTQLSGINLPPASSILATTSCQKNHGFKARPKTLTICDFRRTKVLSQNKIPTSANGKFYVTKIDQLMDKG